MPDRTGRDDAGVETWITRARDAFDVKVILDRDRLLLREYVDDDRDGNRAAQLRS
jgi:hypothetical protein